MNGSSRDGSASINRDPMAHSVTHFGLGEIDVRRSLYMIER